MPFADLFRPRREFTLPPFALGPLEFESDDALLLDSIVVPATASANEPSSSERYPTAGELHESIERHLRSNTDRERPGEAAEELREALAQLRRSIG